ncbi:LysR family transcriptional regulator [Scleromatobacter humisilvae]|uniref:LysR family transcriptional regulator n=1 Tax=Scleromatobacter humisilvae TaxID=2897159 RepID=A0A9X2C2S1_9BURK|nr:LysR family transcriptional regulator [Scleromatobacter humisilvae]MCK9689672.1 LysR family transcriptional regulator [Scleromatobacter humisilvae]
MDKLRAMKTFVQIADDGSLTAAAGALGMSLPAVVRSLAALEAELGARLFQRTTRRLALTHEGLQYLARSRDILAAVAEADASLADETQAPRGRLTVTAPVLLGQRVVADFVTRFVGANPRIRCSVQLLDRYVDLVDEGVDVGIRIGALEDSSLVALRLGEVRQVVVASPQFLRRTGTPKHPAELRTRPCVRLAGPARPGWPFHDSGRRLHVAVDGPLDFNHAGAALLACEQGAGFGQFFSYQVQDALRDKRLRIVLADFESPPQPVSIVYPHARLLPARTRAFIEAAKRELAPLF